MDHTTVERHLLERLATLSGCEYLSDLHDPRFRPAIHRALEWLTPDAYPAAQWREAANYLSCPACAGGNSAQIRRGLLAATAA